MLYLPVDIVDCLTQSGGGDDEILLWLNGGQGRVDARQEESGCTLLILAAMLARADLVKALLLHGASPNLVDEKLNTALHLAVGASQRVKYVEIPAAGDRLVHHRTAMNVIALLLEAGSDLCARNKHQHTPLLCLYVLHDVSLDHEELHALLGPATCRALGRTALECGTQMQCPREVEWAVRQGKIEAVCAWIEGGGDINARCTTHESVLWEAVKGNHMELVETLLRRGAAARSVTAKAQVRIKAHSWRCQIDFVGTEYAWPDLEKCHYLANANGYTGIAGRCKRELQWRRFVIAWKSFAKIAGVLACAHRRAVDRLYAPGGAEYKQAAQEFSATAVEHDQD
uniref:Uncharacterized protein n=1 Tax=Coccolithus braarudii TaxID=221442 RepID=A0A7S0L5W7_9EUKA|mmetsp:Transcript_22162/g.47871  ORF Transcript_22162/g.47871 Transcript_22162/m.47871 type:complete len:342 (+) Transcript_22162:83-1108(+)